VASEYGFRELGLHVFLYIEKSKNEIKSKKTQTMSGCSQ
jgi:hypothetical protein